MAIRELKNSKLRLVELDSKGDYIYIMENKYAEEVVLNRGLVGYEFANTCFNGTKLFVEHFADEFNKNNDIAELMLLSKGFYYRLFSSFAEVLKKNLQVDFLATKRIMDGNIANIEVKYSDLSAKASTLVIGDTIATGNSVISALEHYEKAACKIKKLYLFSFCGSKVGALKIIDYCKKANIDVTIVYGIAAFGFGNNGFDLPFLHKDTITDEKYMEKAKKVFANLPICAVGVDFASQTQCPKKYANLCSLERKFFGVGDEVFPFYDDNIDEELVKKERTAFEKYDE